MEYNSSSSSSRSSSPQQQSPIDINMTNSIDNDNDSDTSGTSGTTDSTNRSHPSQSTKCMTTPTTTTPSTTTPRAPTKDSSQNKRERRNHVSFGTTILSILLAIFIGLLAGMKYSTVMNNNSNSNNSPSTEEIMVTTEEAPQCDDDASSSSSTTQQLFLEKNNKIEFKYVKIKPDEDEDDDEDEDEDDEDDEDFETEKEIIYDEYGNQIFQGVGKIIQFFINAYDIDYFDNDKTDNLDAEESSKDNDGNYDFENNGEEIVTELLMDLIEASDECETIIELYGYFVHDSSKIGKENNSNSKTNKNTNKTLNIVGMLRDGRGQISLTLWPYHKKLMADFFIGPSRQVVTEEEGEVDEDDEDDDEIEDGILLTCISSMAKVLYPTVSDQIIPNNIPGSIEDVTHSTQLGLFESLSKYNQDPYRYRWKIEKLRGFLPLNLNDADLIGEMGSLITWKNRVVSIQSNFQQIDIVDGEDDFSTLGWMESYNGDNDKTDPNINKNIREYMENPSNKRFFQPDRLLYLDGVIQSTRQGLAAYHEALVQPAMFAHPNPKRIAIVGGGECATLRETLKHSTVEKVIMVEIDPIIVDVSKIYLEEWNDCSMFGDGSIRYCMDDPRVEMYHLDALQWFRDRYSNESQQEHNILFNTEELFDVVILDALDPQNAVDFVEALYGDGPFMNSLYNSLTDNGVLLTQVGEAVSVGDISETYPGNFNYQRAQYESGLINQGFEVVMQYDEPRAGFDGIWSFYAAFKDDSIRERWLMNEAQIDLEIHKRSIRRTPRDGNEEDGEMNSLFDVFDGPTMATYRYPSKAAQVIYCLRNPQPYGCVTDINNKDHHTPYGDADYKTSKERPYYEPSGFDPEIPNFNAANFMVDSSNNNNNNSNNLVSRVTIPKNSYLMLEQSIHDVRVAPATSSIVDRSSSSTNDALSTIINPVKEFVSGDREGLSIPRRGDIHTTYGVDSGLLSFLKHGCNGNFNTGTSQSSLTEMTTDPNSVPDVLVDEGKEEGDDGQLLLRVARSYQKNGTNNSKKMMTMENGLPKELVFNPSFTRNSHQPESMISSRTISQGEEIYSNFVPWYDQAGWNHHISTLRDQCQQQ